MRSMSGGIARWVIAERLCVLVIMGVTEDGTKELSFSFFGVDPFRGARKK